MTLRIMVPSAVVLVPLTVAGLATLPFVARGELIFVNRLPALVATPGLPLVVWTAVVLALGMLGHLLVVGATTVIAAGATLGRPVSIRAALRRGLVRLPKLFALLLVAAAGLGLIVLLGYLAQIVSGGPYWISLAVMAGTTLALLPGLMAVPLVVLKGSAGLRTFRLPERTGAAFYLAFWVVVLPLIAQYGAQWASGLVPEEYAGPFRLAAGTTLAMLLTPIQVLMLTRCFVDRVGETLIDLPDQAAGRTRSTVAVLAMVVTGLMVGAVSMSWQDVTQRPLSATPPPGADAGPELDGWLQSLFVDENGSPLVFVHGENHAGQVRYCTTPRCTHSRTFEASFEVGDVAAVPLKGGRVAVAGIASAGGGYEPRLAICRLECDMRRLTGKLPGDLRMEEVRLDVAADSTGGLVVAVARPASSSSTDSPITLSLIHCADDECAQPAVYDVGKLPGAHPFSGGTSIDLAATPQGGLLVGVLSHGRTIAVVTCSTPRCAVPRIAEHRMPGDNQGAGLQLALRPDGRPVMTVGDLTGNSAYLLDCRSADCATADTVAWPPSGVAATAPPLAVGASGDPMTATFDAASRQVVVHTYRAGWMERAVVARAVQKPGMIALATDPGGRPVVVWLDRDGRERTLQIGIL